MELHVNTSNAGCGFNMLSFAQFVFVFLSIFSSVFVSIFVSVFVSVFQHTKVWCGASRPEALQSKLKTAVHAPGKYRWGNNGDFNSGGYHHPFAKGLGHPGQFCRVLWSLAVQVFIGISFSEANIHFWILTGLVKGWWEVSAVRFGDFSWLLPNQMC